MAWWVAEKGSPLAFPSRTEINEEAAKRAAIAKSQSTPATVFEVRYHMNANAPVEVRWEAVDGQMTEVTGAARKQFRSGSA
jgi:hypothetical protein